jgi:hypothetical protein
MRAYTGRRYSGATPKGLTKAEIVASLEGSIIAERTPTPTQIALDYSRFDYILKDVLTLHRFMEFVADRIHQEAR